jgi:hypothetical protein
MSNQHQGRIWTAVGAIAALAADYSIVVERRDDGIDRSD